MRRILDVALRRKKTIGVDAPALPFDIAGPAHLQEQSAFSRLLSTDVRLFIYEAVFTSAEALLHIVPPFRGALRGDKNRKPFGHWHCIDSESPFPTWQHKCFGIWNENGQEVHRMGPRSNSDLLPLLLTCRLIYLEAIDVLYTANTFNFGGASRILTFQPMLPAHHWNRIRRLSISTVFRVPTALTHSTQSFPPENYGKWEKICEFIATLASLQRLDIDMTIWNWHDHIRHTTNNVIEPEDFMTILGPLKEVKASHIEVEMNAKLPASVHEKLGTINFLVKERYREYSTSCFHRY